MTIAINSIITHSKIEGDVKASKKRRILEILRIHPEGLTMHEVADIMGVPLHTISGRFGELQYEGRITINGTKKHVVHYEDSGKSITYERSVYILAA